MADQMILKTQQWLNNTYGDDSRFNRVTEDGITGWETINGLIRALQIEFGITATADNFGPTSVAKFLERFPNGVQQQAIDDDAESNIYAIIQGACWCKGYSTGASNITKHFYSGTGNAIKSLKSDAGCSDATSTVTLNVMKALLSMDQFKLTILYGGTLKIRSIQQKLNNKYENYIGLSPCDGLYGRQMNESLIKVLQAIEGYSVENATGNFGEGTKANLPIVPSLGGISEQTEKDAIKLVRYALCCNGYSSVNINSEQWDDSLTNILKEFQGDMCLEQTGACDTNTWMALLLSKGNSDRACNACDTVYDMRDDRLDVLENMSISAIGRYIIGGNGKETELEEVKRIINRGFKFIPIYQANGTPDINKFTTENAINDARIARIKAKSYLIPENSIIYFAVDFDALDTEIKNVIVPYFKILNENIGCYKIGVYGTRNVCTQVIDNGYAETCYVSDSSVGYSGNMGFKMPTNWNLDQYDVDKLLSAEKGNFRIDKVTYSGKYPLVTSLIEENGLRGFISDIELHGGEYWGAYRTYSGNKLKLYVSAEKNDPNVSDDVDIAVAIVAHPQVNPTYPIMKQVNILSLDGSIYSFKNTIIGGEQPINDYMRIESGLDYRIYYIVSENGEIIEDAPVKVHIEIETED